METDVTNSESPLSVTPAPEGKPEKSKRQVRKINIIKFEKRVTAAFSVLSKLFIISVIVVASIFIFKELSDTSYSIQRINVPTSFEEAGFSGEVVAHLISDRLKEIVELLRKKGDAAEYINSTDRTDVDVEMVGMGVPVRGVIALVGEAMGIRKRKQISSDVVVANGKGALILRVSDGPTEWFETDMPQNDTKAAVLFLVDEAAKAILKYTDPKILELYYSNIKHDGLNCIKVAQYMLDNYPDDLDMVAHAYDSWAVGLIYEGKMAEAEQKIKEGLQKFPNDQRMVISWGRVLSGLGREAEAIKKFKTAYAMTKNLTTYQRVSILINIGASNAYLNQLDSSMYYFKSALALDKNDWIIYYDIAGVYLLQTDTTRFYEYFERSLEKGADLDMINSDADLKEMMADKTTKGLMQKYAVVKTH